MLLLRMSMVRFLNNNVTYWTRDHRTIDIHNNSITMLKLDEYNRILTVHYSYTSLVSSDECVRRSLVQYVTELKGTAPLTHNHSITMLKLDEFNRILTVHYSYTSLFSSDECVCQWCGSLIIHSLIGRGIVSHIHHCCNMKHGNSAQLVYD